MSPRTNMLMRFTVLLLLPALHAQAGDVAAERPIVTVPSHHDFAASVSRLEDAIKANGMILVGEASASAAAANRGVTIPGDAVLLVFRNDFAVRMLRASQAAGIEAPIPLHVYETPAGGTTIAYRRPTTIFGPYRDKALESLADELDLVFDRIVAQAAD